MTIETKYNIGDEVWVIINHRARRRVVNEVSIKSKTQWKRPMIIDYTNIIIKYYFEDDVYVDEDLCFSTKEELLKSL